MDWRLYDEEGKFLCEVNCEYDACDIARWEYGAVEMRHDFANKEAHITKKVGDRD